MALSRDETFGMLLALRCELKVNESMIKELCLIHKKVQSYLVMLMLALPTLAFAGSWSQVGNVNDFRIQGGTAVLGKLEGVTLVCGTSEFRMVAGIEKEEQVFALLLSAQLSGKKVRLHQTDECDEDNRSLVIGVRILN